MSELRTLARTAPSAKTGTRARSPNRTSDPSAPGPNFVMEIVTVRPQGSAALTTHRWMPNSAPAGVSELLVQPRVLICFGAWLGRQLKVGTDSRGIPQSLPDAS